MSKVSRILGFALQQNINGNKFPVFCVCLGYEALLHSFSGYEIKRSVLGHRDQNEPLQWNEKYFGHSFFGEVLRLDIKLALAQKPLLYFSHNFGFKQEDFDRVSNLAQNFHVLATFKNGKDKVVAAVQHKYFPLVGVQFHPEKILFEHK